MRTHVGHYVSMLVEVASTSCSAGLGLMGLDTIVM